jgi:hypothetical protein
VRHFEVLSQEKTKIILKKKTPQKILPGSSFTEITKAKIKIETLITVKKRSKKFLGGFLRSKEGKNAQMSKSVQNAR